RARRPARHVLRRLAGFRRAVGHRHDRVAARSGLSRGEPVRARLPVRGRRRTGPRGRRPRRHGCRLRRNRRRRRRSDVDDVRADGLMGLELPGELVTVLGWIGYDWPDSDETALFEMGQSWMTMGSTLSSTITSASGAANM